MGHPIHKLGYEHAWILTHTGRRFTPLQPVAADIDIRDIAHALSNVGRFAGHTHHFYSVAQHSVHTSQIVAPENALAALLHDATEAYIADIASPIKPFIDNYIDIEGRLWDCIADRYGLARKLPAEVKQADLVMLATERRDLMPDHPDEWPVLRGIQPLPMQINPLLPGAAKTLFLQRWKELTQ